MSQSAREHRKEAPRRIGCAVVTISDTRTLVNDTGGDTVVERLSAAGHTIAHRQLVRDEPEAIRKLLAQYVADEAVDVVLLTGGTGVTARDQTFEAIDELLTRKLPGFGELFRMLSYEDIGAAAMLSRATAGLVERTALFAMPGSVTAVQLAMDKLIIPELGHLVAQARK